MTEREKVIKGLECCVLRDPDDKQQCDDCPYRHPDGVITNSPCVNGLMGNALSLLKAQEQVKPFVTGNGHTFEEAETWWYECGNCNEPIDPNDQYCRHCGRAVKWDG